MSVWKKLSLNRSNQSPGKCKDSNHNRYLSIDYFHWFKDFYYKYQVLSLRDNINKIIKKAGGVKTFRLLNESRKSDS